MYLPTCCDIAVIFWCKKKGRMSITYWPCFNACKRWLSTLLHSKRVAQPCWIKQSHCSLIPFIPETRHSPVTYSFLTHSYHKTAVSKTHQSELYLVWQLARLFFFFFSSSCLRQYSSLVSRLFQGEHLFKYLRVVLLVDWCI